mmetsp:Transcript_17650/g.29983  ORF Transcript_17650/g.29983 Transcript_17650/m.29983 type:complete len:103 (+) Transcript_17650:21-329(+)
MKQALTTCLLLCFCRSLSAFTLARSDLSNNLDSGLKMSANHEHPFCSLPGDPSLILTTNVDLGDKKMEIMKACSKAIAAQTGKPESYIGMCHLFTSRWSKFS